MLCYVRAAEIAGATGEAGAPLLVAVGGYVFDMASHPSGITFYGPGSGYHVMAGRCVHSRLAAALGYPVSCDA